MTGAEVAKRLRVDLGWFAWATDIERGRANQSDLADALDSAVREKRFWLKNFTYEPNTHGETMQENTTLWCDRASALIVQMQEPEAGESEEGGLAKPRFACGGHIPGEGEGVPVILAPGEPILTPGQARAVGLTADACRMERIAAIERAHRVLGRAVHTKAIRRLFELWPQADVSVVYSRYDGRRTTVVEIKPYPEATDWAGIARGEAHCDQADQFVRRVGIDLAFRRALRKVPR